MRLGFLALLLEKVLSLPDGAAVERVFEPRLLLALASHSCMATRTLVVRLLDALLRMKGSGFLRSLLQARAFFVLANQIRQFPVSDDLFTACCDLCTGQSVRAEHS